MGSGEYDVIVVGAGGMGGATAWHLACDGKRVLLLEQFEIGHTRGSSHGESRVFRLAYSNPAYTRLALQAKEKWRELEKDAGEHLLKETGGIDFADEDSGYGEVITIARTLESSRRPFEKYDWARLARRFPQWKMLDNVVAVFSPEAGVLNPTQIVKVLAARAAAHGCEVHENEAATQITPSADGVEVTTSRGTYRAGKVVLTAGPWMKGVLERLGIRLPLKVTQEQTVYFRPKANAESFRPEHFPLWVHHRKPMVYGFPTFGAGAVKIAFHMEGPEVDIQQYTQTPRAGVTPRLRGYLEKYLPDAAGESFGELACVYTNTPDEDFVVDKAPGNENLIIGSPCSGHGFKFAAAIGRALADLATTGKTEIQIGHLGIGRFIKPAAG